MLDALRSTTASNDPRRPDLEPRLIRCFSAAFAGLQREQIRRADISSLAEWDSLTSMTLLGLIEEEFELRIFGQDIMRLTSFSSILSYLEENVG